MRLDLGLCVVRSWASTDLAPLVRHANDPRVSEHLRDRFPSPYSVGDGRRFLARLRRAPESTVWAVEVDGEAVGGIGIQIGRDNDRVSAEIGYWLGHAYWGRGIGTAALAGVSQYVLEQFQLTRVFALPFADNAASIRVLEKSGYMLEGRLRRSAVKHGRVLDQLLYAIYR